ncbi:hypothetical protein NFI96_024389 [Prochilodus magdalenae]|nr:hypothetical protein NFI96_024389 [Prochilodus magdalenae]
MSVCSSVNVGIVNGTEAKPHSRPYMVSIQGDSGGPLVCHNVASGIVSFGEKVCDATARPNVYTRISAILPWIRSIIGKV